MANYINVEFWGAKLGWLREDKFCSFMIFYLKLFLIVLLEISHHLVQQSFPWRRRRFERLMWRFRLCRSVVLCGWSVWVEEGLSVCLWWCGLWCSSGGRECLVVWGLGSVVWCLSGDLSGRSVWWSVLVGLLGSLVVRGSVGLSLVSLWWWGMCCLC